MKQRVAEFWVLVEVSDIPPLLEMTGNEFEEIRERVLAEAVAGLPGYTVAGMESEQAPSGMLRFRIDVLPPKEPAR